MKIKNIPKDVFAEKNRERFFSKIQKSDDHWLWRGSRANNYGSFWLNGQSFRAHRISYLLNHGKISNEYLIDHKCRNKLCVNPDHLRMVQPRINVLENNEESPSYKNSIKTHCPHGHQYDEKNTGYKWVSHRKKFQRICLSCINISSAIKRRKKGAKRRIFSNRESLCV